MERSVAEANPHASGQAAGHEGLGLGYHVWLQDRGMPVFGAGIRGLLVGVESTGSLRKAASDMGMAYSKAWLIVRRAESHLGFELLQRQAGGRGGGGSVVSAQGKWLVRAFGELMADADDALDALSRKHLGDWFGPGAPARPEDRMGSPLRADGR